MSEEHDLMYVCPATGKLGYSGITVTGGSTLNVEGLQVGCKLCGGTHSVPQGELRPGSRIEEGEPGA